MPASRGRRALSKQPAEQRIAVVVVHGIGFQRPFETLDKVARGVLDAAKNVFGVARTEVDVLDFAPSDRSPRAGYTSDFWERNYFEISAATADGRFRFPILEAYWGHHRDTEIGEATGRRWLIQRLAELDDARLYHCAEDPEADRHTRLRLIDPNRPSDKARLGPNDREIRPWLRRTAGWVLAGADVLGAFGGWVSVVFTRLYFWALSRFRWQDVVAYITTDPQNPLYRVRGEILDEVQERLEAIAEWVDDPKAGVDAVVVVGHSLGSVILVDTINRMRRRPSGREALERLEDKATLVFLGSPVEHILRLVLFRMDPTQRFRNSATLGRIAWKLDRGFALEGRSEPLPGVDAMLAETLFARVPLLNFYAHADPVSSAITTLVDVDNIHRDYAGQEDAHGAYWEDATIYERVFMRALNRPGEQGPPVA